MLMMIRTLLDLFRNKTNFVPAIQDNKLQFMVLARGSSARMLAAYHSGSVGPDTPSYSSTSANPGFITCMAILLRPAGYFVIHRSGSWGES